jgi:hypothetical protein
MVGLTALDPRWRLYCLGTLPPAEVTVLEDEAGKTEEGRRLLDLYRPFDAAADARLVEAIAARLASGSWS